jgi:hypothetical protein
MHVANQVLAEGPVIGKQIGTLLQSSFSWSFWYIALMLPGSIRNEVNRHVLQKTMN